jgi:hypothetical protein
MRSALVIVALFMLGCAKTAVSVADATVELAIDAVVAVALPEDATADVPADVSPAAEVSATK